MFTGNFRGEIFNMEWKGGHLSLGLSVIELIISSSSDNCKMKTHCLYYTNIESPKVCSVHHEIIKDPRNRK